MISFLSPSSVVASSRSCLVPPPVGGGGWQWQYLCWSVRVSYQMRTISSHHIHVVAIYYATALWAPNLPSGPIHPPLNCTGPTSVDTRRKRQHQQKKKNVTECTIITRTEYAFQCARDAVAEGEATAAATATAAEVGYLRF